MNLSIYLIYKVMLRKPGALAMGWGCVA